MQNIHQFLLITLIFSQFALILNQFNENGSPIDDIPKKQHDLPLKLRNDKFCTRDIKFNSIIDLNITDLDYSREIRKSKIVIVFAQLKHCKVCCQHEIFFYDLVNNYLKNESVHPYAKDIKIAYYDLIEGKQFISEYKLYKFPQIIVFKEGKGEVYRDIWDPIRIIRFIARLHKPLKYLKKAEDVQLFLNRNSVDSNGQMIQTLKVLGIFFGGEVEDKLRVFKIAAKIMIERNEVEMAYIKNPKEIQKLYDLYGEQFFWSRYELTNVIIQYFPRQYIMYDIFKEDAFREGVHALKDNALRLVDELTNENWEAYEKRNQPILLFILDTYLQFNESNYLFKLAEQIAQKYYKQMPFCWMEGENVPWRKELLGYTHLKVPGMLIFTMDRANSIMYPEGWPITEFTIQSFVDSYLHKSVEENLKNFEINIAKYQQTPLYAYLQDINQLSFKNYDKFIEENKEKEVFLLVWNKNKYNQSTEDNMVFFNQFPKYYKAKSKVILGYYDQILQQKLPLQLSDLENSDFEALLIYYPSNQHLSSSIYIYNFDDMIEILRKKVLEKQETIAYETFIEQSETHIIKLKKQNKEEL